MRRTAVLSILFLTAALAADERPLSTPVVSAAFGSQAASIATDGSAYLVVWTDTRAVGETTVLATPFGSDGKPAGPTAGIPALRRRTGLTTPQVKWMGSSYLAVWRETTTPGRVQWLRLDRNGTPLDAEPRSLDLGKFGALAVASAGTRILLLSHSSGSPAMAALLDAGGNVVKDPFVFPFPIVRGLAGNGQSFLVAGAPTDNTSDTTLVPLSLDGVAGATTVLPSQSFSQVPIVAVGSDYLVFWAMRLTNFLARERFDSAGVAQSFARIGPELAAATIIGGAVVANGSTGFVVPQASMSALLFDRNGDRTGDKGSTAAPGSDPRGVEVNAAGTLLFARARASSGLSANWTRLFVQAVGQEPATLLSVGPPPQEGVAIAQGSDGYMTAWLEVNDTNTVQLRAARLDRDGAMRDGAGILVAAANVRTVAPAVGFDGRNYTIAWVQTDATTCSLRTLRFSPEGTPLDPPAGRVAGACSFSVAIASGPRSIFIVSQTAAGGAPIVTLIVDQEGVFQGVNQVSVFGLARDLAAAWSGGTFLTAWVRDRPGFANRYDLYAARVTEGNQLLDATPIIVADDGDTAETNPTVAGNGTDFLVAWSAAVGSAPANIISRRFKATGTPFEPGGAVFGKGTRPAAAWVGNDYAVSFQDAGQLVMATFAQPDSRRLLAPSVDSNVRLLSAPGVLSALYTRNALEWPWNGTARAYLLLLPRPHTRTVR